MATLAVPVARSSTSMPGSNRHPLQQVPRRDVVDEPLGDGRVVTVDLTSSGGHGRRVRDDRCSDVGVASAGAPAQRQRRRNPAAARSEA